MRLLALLAFFAAVLPAVAGAHDADRGFGEQRLGHQGSRIPGQGNPAFGERSTQVTPNQPYWIQPGVPPWAVQPPPPAPWRAEPIPPPMTIQSDPALRDRQLLLEELELRRRFDSQHRQPGDRAQGDRRPWGDTRSVR